MAGRGRQRAKGAWYVTTEITGAGTGRWPVRRVAVKDNIAVAGVPMMNGSRTVEGFVPRRDATVVTRLLDAGATIAGKAVCEDLCFSGGSHTSRTGPVRNPWDRSRTAGGSSSGSAALVAAGAADLALGGDQGGSIRIPSAFCGTVGHKPTRGLVPYTGAFPIENTLDHLGPITRTVRDAALMLGVLAGPGRARPRQRATPPPLDFASALEAGAGGLRVGVLAEGFGIPGLSQPAVDDTVRAAIDTLAGAGAAVSERQRPLAPRRHARLDRDRHRRRGHADGERQRLRDELAGLLRPGARSPTTARGAPGAADELPETVKATIFAGRYAIDSYHGRYYAMARNLASSCAAAYDAALPAWTSWSCRPCRCVATADPPARCARARRASPGPPR